MEKLIFLDKISINIYTQFKIAMQQQVSRYKSYNMNPADGGIICSISIFF